MTHIGALDVTELHEQRLLEVTDPTVATDPAPLMRCSHKSIPLPPLESAVHAAIPSHIL